MLKKVISIVSVLVLILSLAGCQSQKPEAPKEEQKNTEAPATTPEPQKEPTSVDKIKQAGVLVMATSADYPPFEGIDPNDPQKIIGFDVDISEAVAKKLGVKLEIKNIDFKGLLEALSQGKANIVVAGMAADEERKQSVDFSKVYFVDKFMLVVKDSNDSIKTVGDMDGKKIGAQLGSTCQKAAEAVSGVQLKTMDKVDQLLLEVKSGRLDGAVVNLVPAAEYKETLGGIKLVDIPELNKEPEGYAVAIKKGDTELVKVIDQVIDELKTSGDYDKLIEKWGLK